ncbi:MAG TPA: hypothetical protein ENK99_03540 [Campylobacterales bacterium]|nr:hypothetical protein [Campylobacterales bacterium]
MKQTIMMEKYPIFELDIKKSETKFQTADEIIEYLKEKIDNHPIAVYIATFDHYSHTHSLDDGEIASEIVDAKNIVCCFGKQLPKANMLAVRPRSIGVAELNDEFVISFLEAPNPIANDAMESWVKGIVNL